MKPPFMSTQRQSDLDIVLRRRGHSILKTGELERTLFWNAVRNQTLYSMGQFEYVRYFGHDPLVAYMARFGEYSFRKLVTRLMRAGETGEDLELLKKTTGKKTYDFLELLSNLQTVSISSDRVHWLKPGDNIGPSLEHYVAMLCSRELGASAVEWNVILNDVPRGGGEYDIIASLDPNLLYIECKCSDRNIDDSHLREFLHRNEELTPEIGILLVDTDRPIDDIIRRLNKIREESFQVATSFHSLQAYPGVYYGNAQSYVIGNRPSIVKQIRLCLRHFHSTVKPQGGYQFESGAFLKRPNHSVQDEKPDQ